MFNIYYKDNNFFLSLEFESFEDREEYQAEVDYLKSHFISYVPESGWKITSKQIEEMILWFERDNKEYYLNDSCLKALPLIKDQYKREVEFFRTRKFDDSVLREGIKLKEFQKKYVDWRLSRSSFMDAHDTGTGKTISNICVFSHLYNKNLVDGIIIIVPIGLSFNWQEEILDKVNIFKKEDIEIIDNAKKVRPFENFKDKKILIFRHDLYASTIASYRKDYKPGKSLKKLRWSGKPFVNIKKEWGKESLFLCIDEADAFNNLKSNKTKSIFNTREFYDYKSIVSATPWINGIEKSYPILTFIDKSIIPMTENCFKLWLAKSIGSKYDKYAITEYDTEKVQSLMKSYQHIFSQIRKEDLSEIKTKKIFKDIKFEVTAKQKKIYKIVTEEIIKILQEEYNGISLKVLENKMHLILSVFDNPLLLAKNDYDNEELNKLISKWKIEEDPKFIYLKNKLENLIENQNQKVIVYDIHPQSLDLLAEKFKDYNPLVIHGQIKTKDKQVDRKEKEDLFNFDPKHKLFLLSAYTSSRGLNLQYGSSTIIYYTLPFDATPVKQGSERTDRVTSESDSLIEYLYYPNTLDSYRYQKAMNRLELNRNMDKKLTQRDLSRLLNGE